MNFGRIIWWLALITLVMACAGTIVFSTQARIWEESRIQDIANTMHSDFDKLRRAGAVDAEKMDSEFMGKWKDWYVSHGMAWAGVHVTVILFSCLTMFLLATCLIERKRRLRGASRSRDI